MKLSFIPISEVTTRIGCTDARSAEKRCDEMGIKVHIMNKRKYVIEEDINREMELKYISNLKQRYPDRYKEIYLATKEDDYLQVYELINTEIEDNEYAGSSNLDYNAQSERAKNFLKNLKL